VGIVSGGSAIKKIIGTTGYVKSCIRKMMSGFLILILFKSFTPTKISAVFIGRKKMPKVHKRTMNEVTADWLGFRYTFCHFNERRLKTTWYWKDVTCKRCLAKKEKKDG